MNDRLVGAYSRRERAGRLTFATKLFQGVGAVPDTVLTFVFSTFVLLFYNRVLGINALLVSAALAIAVIADAGLDPLVASISDNLHTRWGRRHPLMLFGAAPLGPVFCGVFMPPHGLSPIGLFIWLTTFVLLTRALLSLFFVPWSAIAAELTDNYEERTSVMSFRFAVGWAVGVGFPLFVFGVVMSATAGHPVGQLNPTHYPVMAISAAALMSGAGTLTTLLTRREIPYMRQHVVKPAPFRPNQILRELARALGNRQFALVFTILILTSALDGATGNIDIYMSTYFWKLTSEDLRWFTLAAAGAAVAFPLVTWVQRRWDKKHILMVATVINLANSMAPVALRFAGLLPRNGDPILLAVLVGSAVFGATVAVVQGVIGASVVADILDQHELQTGFRQEAMFVAALSFSGKAVSGLGIVLGGLILTIVAFPAHAAPGEVAPHKIALLGLMIGLVVPAFYLIPISLIRRYRITRAVHAEIRRELDKRQTPMTLDPTARQPGPPLEN
jgi:GPH family glycoside/pentoside/hexuronide:cation symporter